jgi:hypothetical protein
MWRLHRVSSRRSSDVSDPGGRTVRSVPVPPEGKSARLELKEQLDRADRYRPSSAHGDVAVRIGRQRRPPRRWRSLGGLW